MPNTHTLFYYTLTGRKNKPLSTLSSIFYQIKAQDNVKPDVSLVAFVFPQENKKGLTASNKSF